MDKFTADMTSATRLELIRDIAAKLPDSTILNTVKSRARCRKLAREITQLLDDEDAYQAGPTLVAESDLAEGYGSSRTCAAGATPVPPFWILLRERYRAAIGRIALLIREFGGLARMDTRDTSE